MIHDNANLNVANLATYGVTAAIITTLQTSITNFDNTIPKGRVDTTDSGEATHLRATLFKTLSAHWAKIDTLVEMVLTSQPNFYSEYQKVRKVIETGTGSLALKIQANDLQSGEGVANVTLTLAPVKGQAKAAATNTTSNDGNNKNNIVKKTAPGGGSNFKSLPDGDYTVNAKKPGYKVTNVNVGVVNGELTVLNINIDKV